METVGIILLVIFAFIFFGLLGWVLKAIGVIFEFLCDGCLESFGCLFLVILIGAIIILMVL